MKVNKMRLDANSMQSATFEAEESITSGLVPLTPSQLRFLNRNSPDFHHWNLSMRFDSSANLKPELLKQVLAAIIAQHDALRLRIKKTSTEWRQYYVGLGTELPFEYFDFSDLDLEEIQSSINRITNDLQGSLNLSDGPILRLAQFALGRGRGDQIVFIVHHLFADFLSFLFLMDDFQLAYEQLERGDSVCLTPKLSSFNNWSQKLVEFASSKVGENYANKWLDLPWNEVRPIPRDFPGQPNDNSNSSARTVSMGLNFENNQAEFKKSNCSPQEILLVALYQALSKWIGSDVVLIDVLRHGRDSLVTEIDVSQSVGMYISYTPLLLKSNLSDEMDPCRSILGKIRDFLNWGWTFDTLRYLFPQSEMVERLQKIPAAEILFNYRGKMLSGNSKSLLKPNSDGHESDHSPQGLRDHPISVAVDVLGDRLKVTFVYSNRLHRQESIEKLIECFKGNYLALCSEMKTFDLRKI